AARVPHVLRPRRLRDARRRRRARGRAAGLCVMARRAVERSLARHVAQRGGAGEHRRGAPARVLAPLGEPHGGPRVTKPLDDAATVSRAEAEDLLYHEAELLDAWKLDDWLKLLTDDATYFVPPNDKPDADHRYTLFTIADDIVRLRERII